MKPVIYVLFAIFGISAVFADDIVVRSFPINVSFPNPEHLLKQEVPKYEGTEVRIPYMICGVLTKEDVAKYGGSPDESQRTSESKVALPNGGFAEVTIIKEEIIDGITRFDSKIRFTGSDSDNDAEVTITTYDGNGILIRCDTNGKGDPQIILLQIEKKG